MNLILIYTILLNACVAYTAARPGAHPAQLQQTCSNDLQKTFNTDQRKCHAHTLKKDAKSNDDTSRMKLRIESIAVAEGYMPSRVELFFRDLMRGIKQVLYRMGLAEGTLQQRTLDKAGRACKSDWYREVDHYPMCIDIRARSCWNLHVSDAVVDDCAQQAVKEMEGRRLMMRCWHCPLEDADPNAPMLFFRVGRKIKEDSLLDPRTICGMGCGYYQNWSANRSSGTS